MVSFFLTRWVFLLCVVRNLLRRFGGLYCFGVRLHILSLMCLWAPLVSRRSPFRLFAKVALGCLFFGKVFRRPLSPSGLCSRWAHQRRMGPHPSLHYSPSCCQQRNLYCLAAFSFASRCGRQWFKLERRYKGSNKTRVHPMFQPTIKVSTKTQTLQVA